MNSHPVLIVLAIAVAAPLLAEIPIGVRLPVGPQVLGLATAEGLPGWLGGKIGLAALFFKLRNLRTDPNPPEEWISLSVEKEVLNKRVRTGGLPPGYIDQ